MLQARSKNGDVFDFNRDIVQLFPQIAANSSTWLSQNGWPIELTPIVKANKWGEPELVPAVMALNNFCNEVTKTTDPGEAWVAAGFETLHPITRTAALIALAVTSMSAFHFFSNMANPASFSVRQNNYANETTEKAIDALKQDSEKKRKKRASHIKDAITY